jgi:hypothetical protein
MADSSVTMKEIRFAAYRRYEAKRVDASNAMMALLSGAGMASHLLQLTQGSKHLLPEVFPQVPHIGRFNLRTELAREILDAADAHLAAMSIPYALAIHDDFLRVCIDMLTTAKACTAKQAVQANGLVSKHVLIEQVTRGAFNANSLRQLNTIRLMRNCTIHESGRADQTLLNDLATWTPDVATAWSRLTGDDPRRLGLGADLSFGHGEMILTLAVTKVLAREANQLLLPVVPRHQWADMVIADLVDSASHVLHAPDVGRRARGLSNFHYSPLQLTDDELKEACLRHRAV